MDYDVLPDNTMKKEPFVYVMITNFNERETTLQCLDLVGRLDYKNFRVILVENSDKEDISEEIKRFYPEVILIRNICNLGPAAGRNVGIKYALDKECDYIFFLDNDCVVEPSTLTEFVKKAEGDAGFGVVGAKTYFCDVPRIYNFGGKIDWLRGRFVDTDYGRPGSEVTKAEKEADT